MTPEELTEFSLPDLKTAYTKAIVELRPQQIKLVEGLVGGKNNFEAGHAAGYKMTASDSAVRRVLGLPKVIIAMGLSREIASRGAKTTAEWLRKELKELMEEAKADGDRVTVTNCIREFAKIDGLYSEQQLKLMHANHEGGPLNRDVSDDEWRMLSQLHHDVRIDEESIH